MASPITENINQRNIAHIRDQINQKKGDQPYWATYGQSSAVITDQDTFPYPRWYRGVPESSAPVVAEREAGWRFRHDSCYRTQPPPGAIKSDYPNHCFEMPCSTVYPCYPEYLRKFADREALHVILNKACLTQYR